MRTTRRIRRHAANVAYLAVFTTTVTHTALAQGPSRIGPAAAVSLGAGYTVPLRLGVSTSDIADASHIVSSRLAVPSHIYESLVNDTARLDSAAARRLHQRLAHMAMGALGGAAIGATVGGVAAMGSTGQSCHDVCSIRGVGVAYVGMIGLLTGTLIGALWPTH